jgi:hypothetical protein
LVGFGEPPTGSVVAGDAVLVEDHDVAAGRYGAALLDGATPVVMGGGALKNGLPLVRSMIATPSPSASSVPPSMS